MKDLRTVIDQMGREVTFSFPPRRIVSLVPSQTEYLVEIGASVVGRTKFCIHPENRVKNIQKVGGTKNFRFDQIEQLSPDLIIGNKEENQVTGIKQLEKEFPVWMSDIHSLEESYQMMHSISQLTDLNQKGDQIISNCKSSMKSVEKSRTGKVVYLIWQNPWMAAGKNTFIDSMLTYIGYENAIQDSRYPELSSDAIQELKPDHILFSSEPYPFKQKHVDQGRERWAASNCQLVNGELYSWYGSRLKYWK